MLSWSPAARSIRVGVRTATGPMGVAGPARCWLTAQSWSSTPTLQTSERSSPMVAMRCRRLAAA